MSGRVLHVLSQRPFLTGSGVTLDALVREATRCGWDQHVVCGVPASDPRPEVGGLDPDRVHPLTFATTPAESEAAVPFPVPGMSDVMPYVSTVWSEMDEEQLEVYGGAWRRHLKAVVQRVRPQVIHAHHGWVVAGVVREVAASVPVVIHTHGTALRQLATCDHLRARVTSACRDADAWLTLHGQHREAYTEAYGLFPERVQVVGAGYREDLFDRGDGVARDGVAYAGKLSAAKGLPELLDAAERHGFPLHVAGDGAGPEAESARDRMAALPNVTWHGRLDQEQLARLLRQTRVFVLPSYFEGLPLVLVEAAASGCRLVATALPGVMNELASGLGDCLRPVNLPAMAGIDRPSEGGRRDFSVRLGEAIQRSLREADAEPLDLRRFTWAAVFGRVERVWSQLLQP